MTNKQLIFAGKRETESSQLEHHWSEIDTNHFEPEKKKYVFILGGNNTDNPEYANGYAKGIETLLNSKTRKSTDIISFYFASEPIKQRDVGISEEYKDEIKRIYQKMIRPFLIDQYGNIKKVNGFESTFKNIVFVSHCGGTNFLNYILDFISDDLSQVYDANKVAMMIGKIQALSYAPNELIRYNVNSLSIMPTCDVENSWTKIISAAQQEYEIDNDFPKGFTKQCLKSKNLYTPGTVIKDVLQNHRACCIKQQKQFYVIPNQLNPNASIGDHSFDCLYRPSILDSDNDCSTTAQATSDITKLFLNTYLSDAPLDSKSMFNKMINIIEEQPPEQERE